METILSCFDFLSIKFNDYPCYSTLLATSIDGLLSFLTYIVLSIVYMGDILTFSLAIFVMGVYFAGVFLGKT